MSVQAMASLLEVLANRDEAAAAARLAEATELRTSFVERFPTERWADLDVEEYALGTSIDGGSVCWWLEYHTRPVGSIAGGSAKKHLIWQREDETWRFPPRYSSLGEAWESVRAGFVEMLALAAHGDFTSAYDVGALSGAAALRMKTLYMYFPDELLPIFRKPHLDHFLGRLDDQSVPWATIDANRRLMSVLRAEPQLASLSNQDLMFLLYEWDNPQAGGKTYKIAPGPQGLHWDDCLAGGYICVGWDEVGDLNGYSSKDDFKQAFGEHYPYNGNNAQVSRKANELWVLMELEPGDRVVANRGTSEVLGIGTVTDAGYAWRPDRPEYRHTVSVEWDTTHAGPIEPVKAWQTTTVKKVSAAQMRIITGGPTPPSEPGPGPVMVPVEPLYKGIEEALARRSQVILFGPPGTGKTFAARRAAVWLLEGGGASPAAASVLVDPDRFTEAEQRLSSARDQRQQTWFMVANPSQWSWDQMFADGSVEYSFGRLQRNYPRVRAGDLVVGYSSTPAKRVVALARVTGEYDPDGPPESALSLEPVARVSDGLTYEELQADQVLSQSEPARFRCQGTLFALSAAESERTFAMLAERDPSIAATAETATQRLTRVTFHPSYTYEDFIEGFRPQTNASNQLDLVLTDGVFKQVCVAAAAAPDQRFVVLIDEINRGNIPKVLGELITLIETDKRGLTVRLPQSGDEFAVPSNVWIIGTMNTADRSIQLLDTALRRRFAFVELLPDSEPLTGFTAGDLALDVFIDNLNDRIRSRVGREKQVGHAMFFSNGSVIDTAEEFAAVFRHELLPLLQEYLYESYPALAELLGEDVIDPVAERPTDLLDDPESLCAALAARFGAAAST